MFRALALDQSDDERTNARNVSFGTLQGGQFTLSTQSVILNYPALNLAVRLNKRKILGSRWTRSFYSPSIILPDIEVRKIRSVFDYNISCTK